jgi:xylono-1,5-lactonase
MTGAVTPLAQVGARVGESPLWLPDRGVWLWLDMQGRKVHVHDPQDRTDRVIAEGFAEDLACILRWTADAALLVTVRGFHRLPLSGGPATPVACPVRLPEGTIFNDGKVDRHGALWIGSSDLAETAPIGSLWRVTAQAVSQVATGFVVSNGPAFSPAGDVAYFADTYARQVLRFALDGAGVPQGRTVFAGIAAEEGYPDGMTVDGQGTLHVGHWGGARISRWLPDGTRRPDLTVAARNVTSLAFGGPQLGTALVTTAMLFPGQPEATEGERNGDLFSFEAAVPGLEEPELARDWAPKRA